jgi:SNF2 family DNA or RNA helicase
MSNAAEWILEDSTLYLKRGSEAFLPSALEVLRSVEDGEHVWPDVPPGKSGIIEKLRFSSYPISLRLVVKMDATGGHGLTLSVAGNARGKDVIVCDAPPVGEHVVLGDTWYPMDQESVAAACRVLDESGVRPGRLNSLRGFLNLRKAAQAGGPVEDQTSDAILPPMLFVPPKGDSPRNVDATLYGYQDDGWRWLKFMASQQMGGILADEMGLGKTLQIISLLSDAGGGKESVTPTLIVAPGSLLENWKREFTKFAPALRILKHHGVYRTGRAQQLTSYDVVVTSYDTIVRDGGMFGMIEWPLVVLDEAQYIKNPGAIRTRAVKALRRRTSIAVTGTPLENRLSDLWSLMDFAIPGHLGTLSEFQTAFEDSVDAAARLEELISPVMLRRLVRDVANDLPERIDIPQAVELTADEANAYENMRNAIFAEHGQAATLVSLTKLRMFCAHPSIADGAAHSGEFSKLERLRDILEEIIASAQKVIIFTSYTEMADMIARFVSGQWRVFSATLDGRLPIDDRQPLIDRFSGIGGAAVLILNPKAGGAGLNITAANHVIHYNLEWNPAVEDQASARAHRRGQILPVTVHRLYCAGTVEEVVNDRSMRKRELSDAAIVGVTGKDEDYADILRALQRSPIQS